MSQIFNRVEILVNSLISRIEKLEERLEKVENPPVLSKGGGVEQWD